MTELSGGGQTTTKTEVSYDPTIQALQSYRLQLAQQLAGGGLPAGMEGYINKVLIPSTTNTLTASGLGRSGAVGEAVSQAVLSQGTSMLTQLLTGIPGASGSPTKQTGGYEPGFFDYFSSIMGAVCKLGRAIYGGETFEVSIIRSWMFRHPRVAKLYARFGGYFVPVAWMFKPVFAGFVRHEIRKVACIQW